MNFTISPKIICIAIITTILLPTVVPVEPIDATPPNTVNLSGIFERGNTISGTYLYSPYTVYAAYSGGHVESNGLDIFGNYYCQFYLSGVSETSDSKNLIGMTSIQIHQYYSYNYPTINFLDSYCYSTPSMAPTPIIWGISEDTINRALLKIASMAAPSIWGDAISLISDFKTYGGTTTISSNNASKSCTWYNFVANTAQSIVVQPSVAPDDVAYFTSEYCVLGPDYEYFSTGKQISAIFGPDVLPPHYGNRLNTQDLFNMEILPLELQEDLEITGEDISITPLNGGGLCLNARLPTITEVKDNIHDHRTLLKAISSYIEHCNNILDNPDVSKYLEKSGLYHNYNKALKLLSDQKNRISELEDFDYSSELSQFYQNISLIG